MSNLHLDDNEIKRLHDAGLSARQIAIVMECSKSTILNHIRKINGQEDKIQKDAPGGEHRKKGIPLQDIIDLHDQGYTDKEISAVLGCSRSNITVRLNRAGIIDRKSKIDNIELRNKISDSLRGTGLGSDNPNYKGVDDTEDLIQYYKKRARGLFKTLAKIKIRNEGSVCKICGKETQTAEVHHIRPFQTILDEFLIDAYDEDINTFSEQLLKYKPFMDMDNLIIVCPTCHSEIHRKDNPELSCYLKD